MANGAYLSASGSGFARLECRNDPHAFANGKDLICFDSRKVLDCLRGWPFYFDQIDGLFTSQSKVQSQVALRHNAAAAVNFVHLGMLSSYHAHPRPNSSTVALCSDQFDLDPVLLVTPYIVEQRRKIVHVVHKDIDATVIVVVAKRRAAA